MKPALWTRMKWLAIPLFLAPVVCLAEMNFPQVVLDASYVAYERDVGDIDGDGDNDVIAVQEGDTTVEVFKAPGWTRSTLVSITGTYRYPRADDFKVADVDGDLDVDVIVRLGLTGSDDGPGIAVWYENLGGGSNFTQRLIGNSLEYVKDIVVADFDRDNRPDVAMRMDSQTQLWLQNAGGTWSEVLIPHPAHEGMEAGDLDMDGDPDLIMNGFWFPTPDTPAAARVVSNYVQRTIDSQWFTQGGDWTANSCKVVVGDFDGDQTNDVAFSQSERAGFAVTWYRSPTPLVDASWTARVVTVVDYCHNLQAVDWDLDGDDDLMVGGMVQSQHKGLKLMLNDGTGFNWTTFVVQSDGSYSAEIGDIDEDGDTDIVGILNWNSAPTYIYRNNAGGGPSLDFWFYKEVSASHVRSFGLCFPDVDADSDRDIASGPHVFINPGGPMTSAWTRLVLPGGVNTFAATDVDGDGLSDLLALKENIGANRIDIYWTEASNATGSAWGSPLLVGDVPRSDHAEGFQGSRVEQIESGGKPEVVISTMQGIYYFAIPVNPATGAWPRIFVASNDSDEGIGVADIDGDSDLDIAFSSGGTKNVTWARNPGNGSSSWPTFTIGSFPEADWPDRCGVADLNGDGRQDIVVTEENSGASPDALACWWEQPATGATNVNWTRRTIATQYTMNNLDVSDMDQDGDVDVVLAEHRGTEKIGVWENNGSGSFTERPVGSGRESHLGAQSVDLDGDGDLDLVSIAYDDFTKVHLWRNDSPSGTPRVATPVINPPGSVFDDPVAVTIASSTPGAALWYTLDGSEPSVTNGTSTLYSNALLIATSTTLRARGFKDGFDPSLIASATFSGPSVKTPVLSPPGGVFATPVTVSIQSATTGAVIRFTTNGVSPDETSPVYSAPFTVTTSMTVRAKAFKAAHLPSSEASALFNFAPFAPIAHWRLDERFGTVVLDSSGSGHTGVRSGGVWTNGYFRGALLVDGIDDHVAIPAFDIAGTSMAVTAWVRLDPSIPDNDARIFSKATGSSEQSHYWMLSLTSVSNERRLRFRLKTGGTTTTLIAGSGDVPLATWCHVAAVYDGSAMKLYLDGTEVGSTAKSGTLDASPTTGVMLGANPPDVYAPFKGHLDDVRVYGRRLSPDDVTFVMQDIPPEQAQALTATETVPGELRLSTPTDPGRWYILQSTTNLVAPTWISLITNAGDGTTSAFTNMMDAAAEAFRVIKD